MPAALNLTNVKIGDLICLHRDGYFTNSTGYAWICKCVCGKTCRKRSRDIAQALKGNMRYLISMHCGCKGKETRKYRKKNIFIHTTNTPGYQTWARLKNAGLLCESWKDFDTYIEECLKFKHKYTPFLLRKDESKPLSKDNFFWSDRHQSALNILNTAINIKVSLGESRENATKWANEVTRQRLHQYINEAKLRASKCLIQQEVTTQEAH